AGRDFYGLNSPEMKLTRVVAFRVHEGDEASCLNLNRAQKPRLLGVDAKLLDDRKAFTFAKAMNKATDEKGWLMLQAGQDETNAVDSADENPANADEDWIVWGMDKKVGVSVDYTDERGQAFKLGLVGAFANSIL